MVAVIQQGTNVWVGPPSPIHKQILHVNLMAWVKQHVHWFLGGRIVVIQQGTNVWVGSPPPIHKLILHVNLTVGAKQPVHWLLGSMVAVIQQGANVWFGSPSHEPYGGTPVSHNKVVVKPFSPCRCQTWPVEGDQSGVCDYLDFMYTFWCSMLVSILDHLHPQNQSPRRLRFP